jgi:predicted dienelactone hydrolase
MTQWASRGFIVVATDHAGLYLADFLASASLGSCQSTTGVGYGSQNTSADVTAMISGLTSMSSAFSFLGSSADMTRIGISGHSQGASDAANDASKPNVQVDMPLADLGGTAPNSSSLKSTLVVGGMNDSVVPFTSDTQAYTGSTAATKRLVGITGGNHLDVTDLCIDVNSANQTGIQVASANGICGASTLAALAQCGMVNPVSAGPAITNYVTTAALEETLHCTDRKAAFSMLQSKFTQVGSYQHTP